MYRDWREQRRAQHWARREARWQRRAGRPYGWIGGAILILLGVLLVGGSPAASRPLPSNTSSAPSTRPFSGWVSLGKTSGYSLGLPVVGYNQDGRIELFALGSNDHVWHIFQTAPNGAWSTGWGDFVGGDCYCAIVGENLDGRMELFTLQYDLAIWLDMTGAKVYLPLVVKDQG